MRTRPRPSLVAAVLAALVGLGYAASASTLFVPDGDTGALLGILSNGLKQLAALNQQLGEARKTYQSTKTLVGYASDAAKGFDALLRLDFNKLEQSFIAAVPNAGFFDREARGGYRSWGQSTGELQLLVQQCMSAKQGQIEAAAQQAAAQELAARQAAENGQPPPRAPLPLPALYDPCTLLGDRLSGREVVNALGGLFADRKIPGLAAPSVAAQREAERQAARDLVTAQKLLALRALCQDEGTANADKCRAATAAAQFLSAQQLVDLTSRMADLTTVAATQLALQLAEREQRRQERDQERRLLFDAAGQVAPPPVRFEAPGLHLEE